MPSSAPRLPGLRFETVLPPAPSGLPRMDVAAFVGFARRGPVGVPVAVDDEVRFRELFGGEVPLAWDRARGEILYAHLAPAVREFFRNGGRRCWVVRVADPASLEASTFRVPGVLHGRGAAYLLASSPGSWADGVSVNAALLASLVPPSSLVREADGIRVDLESADLLRLLWPDGTVAFFPPRPGEPARDASREERAAARVRPIADSRWFRPAPLDALELDGDAAVFLAGPRDVALPGPLAWERVEDGVETSLPPGALPGLVPGGWIRARAALSGADGGVFAHMGGPGGFLGGAPPPEALPGLGGPAVDETPWLVVDPPSLAPPWGSVYLLVDDVIRNEEETRLVVRQGWRMLRPDAAWPGAVLGDASAAFVSLELWRRSAEGEVLRVGGVGLAPGHPRFVGVFPSDQARFAPEEELVRSAAGGPGGEDPVRRTRLAAPDAALFELQDGDALRLVPRGAAPAAPDADAAREPYLPLGLPAVLRDDFYQGAHHSWRGELTRDGLGAFSAELFLDDALADCSAGTLLDTAFHNAYVAQPPLPPQWMHALLPVAEVSLLAVPDAVHPGWERRAEKAPPPATAAPAIEEPIAEPDEEGRIAVAWSAVEGALGYTLQDSADPRFRAGVGTTEAAGDTEATVHRPRPCPDRLYFRVRARTTAGPGAWSAAALLERGAGRFDRCGRTPLAAPSVSSAPSTAERITVSWTRAAEAPELAARRADLERVFRVESSPEPTFSLPELVYEGSSDSEAELWKPLTGTLYLRAASWLLGPDGAVVEESPWSAVHAHGTEAPLRWETLRPSAAEDVAGEVHAAMLRFCAARSDCFAVLALPRHHREEEALAHAAALTAALGGGSTEPGDAAARTLSFGALYHPWTVVRTPVAAAPLRAIPPDGATCGVMAARAAAVGAWAAPANQPLDGVAVLEPKLPESVRAAFMGRKVNAVAPFPRGFMSWSEETLSDDPELRGVGVRRLLILLRRLALREGNTYVFESNDNAFRRMVQRQFDALLGDLFVRGAFAGATHEEGYRVVTDETVNPPRLVEQGRLVVELRVAPSRPMAFLTVRLVQTGAGVAVQEG